MALLRYVLMIFGIGLLVGAAGILVIDLFQIVKTRKNPPPGTGSHGSVAGPRPALRWGAPDLRPNWHKAGAPKARKMMAQTSAPLPVRNYAEVAAEPDLTLAT